MIRRLIKKIFYNPYSAARRAGAEVGTNTILTRNFQVTQMASSDTSRIRVGNNCILDCVLVFESRTGSIEIGDKTYIGGQTSLISAKGIKIGNNVTIAWGVTIYDHDSHSLDYRERILDQERQLHDWPTGNFILSKDWSVVSKREIVIEPYAWIGFDAVILKGVTVGEGAVIGARSVVTRDVEPWTVVAGNPARIIKRLERGTHSE